MNLVDLLLLNSATYYNLNYFVDNVILFWFYLIHKMNTNQFLNLILLFSMAVDDVIITNKNFYQNFLYRPLQKNKLIHNLFYLIFSYVCVYVCVYRSANKLKRRRFHRSQKKYLLKIWARNFFRIFFNETLHWLC